jgi:hypothetical protein
LKLGYDTVPKFLSLYKAGLPSKLKAHGTDQTTSLVTFLYSEVGQLNEVIKFGDMGQLVQWKGHVLLLDQQRNGGHL